MPPDPDAPPMPPDPDAPPMPPDRCPPIGLTPMPPIQQKILNRSDPDAPPDAPPKILNRSDPDAPPPMPPRRPVDVTTMRTTPQRTPTTAPSLDVA